MGALLKWFSLSLLLVVPLSLGCGGRPDPRENPDFNEQAMEDPMAIEMDSP